MDESPAALQLAYQISGARLGRRRLAHRTGLTEMSVRTELDRLRDRKLVRLQRAGVDLTPAGRRRFARLLDPIRSVAQVELTSLRLDTVGLAAHLAAREADPAWALRDEAIREGATGLLLLRFGHASWSFAHDGEPIAPDNPEDARTIEAAFPGPSAGDLLLIASGPDLKRAGLGLWRAVLAVLEGNS